MIAKKGPDVTKLIIGSVPPRKHDTLTEGECADCLQLLDERDDAQEWADELAARIANILGVEIGEHSNLNNPWQQACDFADGFLAKRAEFAESRKP